MKNNAADSQTVLKGFTVKLAAMDALPVLFFSGSATILSIRFPSVLFRIGALQVILAGALKVSWKFIIALARRNIIFLNRQMRCIMPAGFLLIVLALIIDKMKWSPDVLASKVVSFPSIIFFIAGTAGMVCMSAYARIFSGTDARANWIEQWTNTVAQACIFLGVLLCA
jgi:hypothetical protein